VSAYLLSGAAVAEEERLASGETMTFLVEP